jgi:hypothetical protein
VIDQVVLPGRNLLRRTKVHAIRLARILNLLMAPRQPNKMRVKLSQILFQHRRAIPRRIARDHNWQQDIPTLLLNLLVYERHLVQLVRADVRTMAEAKVHERVLAQHVVGAVHVAVLVDERKGSAYFGLAHALGLLCYPLACHALFLVGEVGPQAAGGGDEEDCGGEVEGPALVACLNLVDCREFLAGGCVGEGSAGCHCWLGLTQTCSRWRAGGSGGECTDGNARCGGVLEGSREASGGSAWCSHCVWGDGMSRDGGDAGTFWSFH